MSDNSKEIGEAITAVASHGRHYNQLQVNIETLMNSYSICGKNLHHFDDHDRRRCSPFRLAETTQFPSTTQHVCGWLRITPAGKQR